MRLKNSLDKLTKVSRRLKERFKQLSRLRRYALISGAGAVILGIIILRFPDSSQIFLWILDILLIISGVYLWEKEKGEGVAKRMWRKKEIIILLFILGLALFFRTYRLSELPRIVSRNEWGSILEAAKIREGQLGSPFEYLYSFVVRMPSYWITPLMIMLRNNILAPRLTHALAGTGAVLFMFLFMRRLFNLRTTYLASLLMAVSVISVSLSRYTGFWYPVEHFFGMGCFYFFLKGLQEKRSINFCLSGIFMGASMIYTHYMVVCAPLVVFLFIIYEVLTKKRPLTKEYVLNLGLLFLCALVVFYPRLSVLSHRVGIFGPLKSFVNLLSQKGTPAQFIFRKNIVNLFLALFYKTPRDDGIPMVFNKPLLDSLTAVFFIIGLAYSIYHWRRPKYFLLFIILIVMSLPPIFVKKFITHRVRLLPLGIFPLAGVGIQIVWKGLENIWQRGKVSIMIAMLLLLSFIVGINYYDYFHLSAKDKNVWKGFPEEVYVYRDEKPIKKQIRIGGHCYWASLIAKEMLQDKSQDRLYFVVMHSHNMYGIARASTYGLLDYEEISSLTKIPLQKRVEKDLIFLVLPELPDFFAYAVLLVPHNILELVKYYYPSGQLEELRDDWGESYGYKYMVSKKEALKSQGVVGRYYPQADFSASPALVRRDKRIDFDWRKTPPLEPPFSVEWEGSLLIPEFNHYLFFLPSPGRVEIKIDGRAVREGEEIILARGAHHIRIRTACKKNEPLGKVAFFWTTKGRKEELQLVSQEMLFTISPYRAHGLLGNYYLTAQGGRKKLLFRRLDPAISLSGEALLPESVSDIEWKGKIYAPLQGVYGFFLCSRGKAALYIDGQLVMKHDSEEVHEVVSEKENIFLEKGMHRISLEHFPFSPRVVALFWTLPGSERKEVVPMEMLYPVTPSFY